MSLPCYTAGMRRRDTVIVLACALLAAACARAPSDDPDLLLTGGLIYPLGPTDDTVQALAIRGDSILAIGTNADILQLAGPYTQQMQLEDTAVLPGSYDAWIDLEALGRWSATTLDLSRASSIEEVQAMIRNAAGAATPAEDWIVGWGWDENDWPEPTLPDRRALDAAGLPQPIALLHRSGLMAWLNSAALAALAEPLGDQRGSDDVPSDAEGPTGIVRGKALGVIDGVVAADEKQRESWLSEGARRAAAAGITRAATPPVDTTVIERLLELEFRGLLPLRVDIRLRADAVSGFAGGRLQRRVADSELLRVVGVGLRLDGPLGSRLAAVAEPYVDGTTGLLLADETELAAALDAARSASLPLHIQASGDRAIVMALEALSADSTPGSMIIGFDLPPDPATAATAGIGVAMAASRFARDIYFLDDLLGPERARRAHAWKDADALGVSLVFASDAPGYPLRPLAAMAAALTRQDAAGYPAGGWNIDQAMPQARLARALIGPLHQNGAGLEQGGAADLVVWSEDPVRGDAGALRRAEAMLTIVAGRVAYSRPW